MLKVLNVRVDHFVDFFTCMDCLQGWVEPQQMNCIGDFTTAFQTVMWGQSPSRFLARYRVYWVCDDSKCGEYLPVMTTLSSPFGRYAHART